MPLVSAAVVVCAARSGQVVSFPTDTVPALAVLPRQSAQLYRLKGRSEQKPLIAMAATIAELLSFVDTDRPAAPIWQAMLHKYLPGAVTFVLPVNAGGATLNPGLATIGVRVPRCQVAIGILQQTGLLLTTSANRSNQPPLTSMAAIDQTFPEVMVWGTGDRSGIYGTGQPSAVIAWQAGQWQILRSGAEPVEALDSDPVSSL